MPRYLLFAGRHDTPTFGADTYIGEFSNQRDLKKHLETTVKPPAFDWRNCMAYPHQGSRHPMKFDLRKLLHG